MNTKSVIITGSTGMVGKGVLLECLDSPLIERVLVINRSSLGMQHPKLKEILLADFQQVATLKDQLKVYDACFYCMGVSVIGLSEEAYHAITYTTTKTLVDTLYELNPAMVFHYVSGVGTDSSEKGSVMWARVKGKTENMVLQRGFADAYAVRLGVLLPERGIMSKTPWYNVLYQLMRPFFPLFRLSKNVISTSQLGQAMINTLYSPLPRKIVTNRDLNALVAGLV